MKPRFLNTIHDLVVSNYTINPRVLPNGKFQHTFTPLTTSTLYEFEEGNVPILVEGEHYSIGFEVIGGRNVVDVSAIGKAGNFNKMLSYATAQQYSNNILLANQSKNDTRVNPNRVSGDYYWGKKYAWRRYGLFMAKDAFYDYLDEINHPAIDCITSNPAIGVTSNQQSKAYKDDGLEQVMYDLVTSAVPVGRYFQSPHFSRKFQIRPIEAITDKK